MSFSNKTKYLGMTFEVKLKLKEYIKMKIKDMNVKQKNSVTDGEEIHSVIVQ